jgi:hypothetical protein
VSSSTITVDNQKTKVKTSITKEVVSTQKGSIQVLDTNSQSIVLLQESKVLPITNTEVQTVVSQEKVTQVVEAGVIGPQGVSSTWLSGSGTPSADLGSVGDMYLDTSNNDIYGPKTVSGWGSVVANISGIISVSDSSTIDLTLSLQNLTADLIGFGSLDTDNLTEGALNKYFADALARAAISGSSPVIYSPTTGEISFDVAVLDAKVPYAGAIDNVNLGSFAIVAGNLSGVNTGDITVNDTDDIILSLTGQELSATFASSDISQFNNDVGYLTGVDWGDIGGTISSQADLQAALDLKYDANNPDDFIAAANSPTKNFALLFNGTDAVWAAQGTSFTFDIATFVDNQASPQLMGVGTWLAIGAISFTASYNNGPTVSGTVQIQSGVSAWAAALDMGAPNFTGPTVSVEAVPYPSTPNTTIRFRLTASDGTDNDTSDTTVYFNNNVFFGISTVASGYTESDVEGLANTALLSSNTRARTFNVTAGSGEYIIYAYPSRLGSATFTVGGFEGGFESPETVSVTNTAGFEEDYLVYRSTNTDLGNTTVVVS